MGVVWAAILAVGLRLAAGVSTTTYDQRQEGSLNVRADLSNLLLVLAPVPKVAPALMDFIISSTRFKPGGSLRNSPHSSHSSHGPEDTQQHFIESKTAPYHVDIDATRDALARLRPAVQDVVVADAEPAQHLVLAAKSPPVELRRDKNTSTADIAIAPSAVAHAVPPPPAVVAVAAAAEAKQQQQQDHDKATISNKLKRLAGGTGGANAEDCGGEGTRDRFGMCRFNTGKNKLN